MRVLLIEIFSEVWKFGVFFYTKYRKIEKKSEWILNTGTNFQWALLVIISHSINSTTMKPNVENCVPISKYIQLLRINSIKFYFDEFCF